MAENKMEQYCKLPIPITAYQTNKEMDIETLEGVMHANVGDYIITGVNGEQYPCKPNIFEKTYIKCGQANKMEQVAAMFGKKLGEKFRIEAKNKIPSRYVARFTKDGIEEISIWGDWRKRNSLLEDLLTGKAKIVGKWGINDD